MKLKIVKKCGNVTTTVDTYLDQDAAFAKLCEIIERDARNLPAFTREALKQNAWIDRVYRAQTGAVFTVEQAAQWA